MRKRWLFLSLVLALGACQSNIKVAPFIEKENGNSDFNEQGNMISADFKIDGILDEPEWEDACLVSEFGGNNVVKAQVTAKVYFGDNGLSVGFYSIDKYISSSTDYNNIDFVVNSDNVEFYIDTLNDGSPDSLPRNDDFTFLINPEEYSELRVGTGSYWGPWSGVIDYAVHVDGTINNDSDEDVAWGCELFLPYKTFGFTKDSVVAIAFGCRDKTTNLKTSEWTGWPSSDPSKLINSYLALSKDGVVKSTIPGYDIASGDFSYDENEKAIVSTSGSSLAVNTELEFENGTYSNEMYIDSINGDNGIIFQVQPASSGLFWEGNGVSYFFFFINFEGIAILADTNNGAWGSRVNVSINVLNKIKTKDYNKLSVVVKNDDIYCLLNDQLVLTYNYPNTGFKKVGVRAGSAGIKYKNATVTNNTVVPGIEEIAGFSIASGTWTENNGVVESSTGNAILLSTNKTLSKGTMSVDVNIPSKAGDNGIIFQVQPSANGKFWEGSGVSYFFFFVNFAGDVILADTNNGAWGSRINKTAPGASSYITYGEFNKFSVMMNGDNVTCLLNDSPVLTATIPNTGFDKIGYRAGISGIKYKNLTISDETKLPEVDGLLEGYTFASGSFKETAPDSGRYQPVSANSLAYDSDATCTNGTLTSMVKRGASGDNGIVFRLNDGNKTSFWEDAGVSYLFFFISQAGSAYLGRVNGGWTNLGENPIPSFDFNKEYELKVVLDGESIKCYVDGDLLVDASDSTCTGNKFGLRAGSNTSTFTPVTVA